MARTLIAIPAYNAAGELARSLQSCVSQSREAEVVVVDNCSTDGSVALVEQFMNIHKNVRLKINDSNIGRVGNWNACLDEFEKSDCAQIVLLFTGDELLPKCVENLEREFEKDDEIGIVVWPYQFVMRNGEVKTSRRFAEPRVLSAHDSLVDNIKEGSILGALVGNAYSRKAIRSHRFREDSMGKAGFDIAVSVDRKIAFLSDVNSRFHVESHRTFDSSLKSQSLPYEVAHASALALEQHAEKLSPKEYRDIADSILLNMVKRYAEVNGYRLLPRLICNTAWMYVKNAFRILKRN